MIIFRKITYRNFLSVGNNPVEIDLAKNKTTLMIGANGEGKCLHPSTIVNVKAKSEKVQKDLSSFLSRYK